MFHLSHFSKSEDDLNFENEENSDSIKFLFDMSKEVKHFYETPVIFLTKKDYSDCVFNTMCNIRSLLKGESKRNTNALFDAISEYHLNWLRIIKDIENFKRVAKSTPREEICQTVSYTIDAIGERLKYYQRYMIKYRSKLSNKQQINLSSDMEIVEEMHKDIIKVLLEKLVCFRGYVSEQEFFVKVAEATEQLCTWVDKIHDSLSILLCMYFNINVPNLLGELAKVLQHIVESLKNSNTISNITLAAGLKKHGLEFSNMVIGTAARNLEITKLIEKIAIVDDRIKRLEQETTTAATLALLHKKEYFRERLESLEGRKINLKYIGNISKPQIFLDVSEDEIFGDTCKDFYQVRIFNHLLPADQRENLVSKLIKIWDNALGGEDKKSKSIISILSAADMKEEFTDELGTFYIDLNGRKIYTLPNDTTLYQSNEHNELVPLTDDDEHIYFYDECGRYYHDAKTRQRVYKSNDTASEYMMDSMGTMLKVKEERGDITYYYDNFGRYYINEDGKHIYREPDSLSEYENDGLGNLVRIRSHLDMFDSCPDDINVTADFRYLESVVGLALRKSIAKIVMTQPVDPIKQLAALLKKYRANMEFHEKLREESIALEAERELVREEERAAAERAAAERAALEAAMREAAGSEASYDTNFATYNYDDDNDFDY